MGTRRWWIAICVSMSAEAYVLYYAIHYGTLSGLLQWDDCIIVQRGFENLDRLAHAGSLLGLTRNLLHLDIHAPLTDAQTMIGLLLSGGQSWGPFLLNATWLAVVLAGLLMTFGRRDWTLAAVVVLFVMLQPLTINALGDIKSDWAGGLLLAGALFLLTRAAQTARSDLKLAAAVLLGLLTLAKLTAFYLPVIAVTALLLFEWYSALLDRGRRPASDPDRAAGAFDLRALWRTVDRRALALRLTIGAGPFVLFLLYSLRPILSYVRSATGSVWDDGLTPLGRVQFYGPSGPDSWMEWGTLHISFTIFAVAALLLAWRRRDGAYPYALLLHAMIGFMLVAPLVVSNSNHSFGATVIGVIVSATLLSMDYLVRSLRGSSGLAVGALVLLIALPAGMPFKSSNYYSQFPVDGAELRQLAGTYARIVDSMIDRALRDRPRVMVFYDHVFAPHPNLAIEFFRKTGRLPLVERVDDLSDARWQRQLAQTDFALTIVPDNAPGQRVPALYPAYPISRDPGHADELVRATGQFGSIGAFAVRGGEIRLYGHVPASSRP